MDLLRRHRVGVVVAVLLVTAGGLALIWSRAQQARGATRSRPDTLVGVVSPQRRNIEVKLSFTADILPVQQAAIFSKVSGYIRKIHVDRGDFVKEGQLLVEIDDQELKASAEQARAALLSSQAGLEVARSTLEGQKANLENQRANLAKARAVAANDGRQADRMKTLFEKGMVAAVDWDNARTNADSSRASTDAAEAQLRLAGVQITTQESQVRLAQAQVETFRAALSLAQSNLSNTRLLAPFAGYVAQRNLDQGAAVSAQSSGTTTTSVGILLIQDISSVKVQIEVPERDIARVSVGAPVRVTADPYKGEVFAGAIARVVHNLDPRSRTMGIEVTGGSSPGCSRGSAPSWRRAGASSPCRWKRCASERARRSSWSSGTASSSPSRSSSARPTPRASRWSRDWARVTRSSSRARTWSGRDRKSAPSPRAAASSRCG